MLRLRPACPQEADSLTALAMRSKAHWGYDAEFLARCRDELTVATEDFDREAIGVCETVGGIAGFWRLSRSGTDAEIEGFFVEPAWIGAGVGRAMWRAVVDQADAWKTTRILCQSDPHAEAFYLAMGMRHAGLRESGSVAGRFLPLLVFRRPRPD